MYIIQEHKIKVVTNKCERIYLRSNTFREVGSQWCVHKHQPVKLTHILRNSKGSDAGNKRERG